MSRYASSSGGHLKFFCIWSVIVSIDKAKRGTAVLRLAIISSAYSHGFLSGSRAGGSCWPWACESPFGSCLGFGELGAPFAADSPFAVPGRDELSGDEDLPGRGDCCCFAAMRWSFCFFFVRSSSRVVRSW